MLTARVPSTYLLQISFMIVETMLTTSRKNTLLKFPRLSGSETSSRFLASLSSSSVSSCCWNWPGSVCAEVIALRKTWTNSRSGTLYCWFGAEDELAPPLVLSLNRWAKFGNNINAGTEGKPMSRFFLGLFVLLVVAYRHH